MHELTIKEVVSNATGMVFTQQDHDHFVTQYPSQENTLTVNLLVKGSVFYAHNVTTKFIVIDDNSYLLIASINEKEYENALTCSPYATYVKYSLEVVSKFDKFWIKAALIISSGLLNIFCKVSKINQIIQIDNTLNSVLKHPDSLNEILSDITQKLRSHYPKHGIVLFRVNSCLDAELLDNLRKNGYLVFADRVTHLFYPTTNYIKRSRIRRDLSLLKNSKYTMVAHEDLTTEDVARIHELYHMLFIKKYSRYNTDYTKEYFQDAIKYRWQHYIALRHPNGKIDGFVSWFVRDNVMVCGPLGYNIKVGRKVGLYRMIIAIALNHAYQKQYIFNLGGGSDQFKLGRGSTPALEYTAVYCRHLPFYRRIIWYTINWACKNFLQKLLKMNAM